MDSIRFKNYRCFSDTGTVSLKPLTLLLGANSSGKSSFLEFFPLLKQSVGVKRNGVFLWYASDVDYKDFGNAVKAGEDSMQITWSYDDFSVNERRAGARIKKQLKDSNIDNSSVHLSLSISISAGKDNFDKLDKLKITFLDEEIVLEVGDSGNVKATVNGRSLHNNKNKFRLIDSVYLLPRFHSFFESEGKRVSSSFSSFFSNEGMLREEDVKALSETLQYESTLYLSKNDYCAFLKSIVNREDVDYDYLRDLYLFYGIEDILETINYRIQAEALQITYVKPLRVMPERYYRYQNYSVEEIDSDGKNLAMFLANLTQSDVRDFQNWTNKYFGFKIYTIKHEGHIELTIGETKKEARNLVDVGFGYTQLLPIITIIWNSLRKPEGVYYYPRVGKPVKIIAIEQPELHLHPRIQALFANVLAKVVMTLPSTQDVRFVIETHSEAIVNAIGSLVQSNELDREKVNVVMFNGEHEGLESYVVEAKYDKDGYLTNWPLGFFL